MTGLGSESCYEKCNRVERGRDTSCSEFHAQFIIHQRKQQYILIADYTTEQSERRGINLIGLALVVKNSE